MVLMSSCGADVILWCLCLFCVLLIIQFERELIVYLVLGHFALLRNYLVLLLVHFDGIHYDHKLYVHE